MNLHSSHSLEGVSGMLAPIGGGSSPSERRRAAKMVADKPVAGEADKLGACETEDLQADHAVTLLWMVSLKMVADKPVAGEIFRTQAWGV
eukprot:100509-Pelagomonas_calceolata.AAC.1